MGEGEEGSVCGRGRREVCVGGGGGEVCVEVSCFFFFKPGTVAVAHRPLLDGSLAPLVHAREVDDRTLKHTPHCSTKHTTLAFS